ncbi:MAG: hypothetical protein ACRDRY_09575 [Pseudonocardiaceae bacterium]
MTGARDERRAWRTVAVPVTSALDGLEHLVADAAIAPGNAGRYGALCGRNVWAAALACPAGPRCPACVMVHNADVVGPPRHRLPNRRGTWARLVSTLRRPRPARSESDQFPDVTLPPSGVVASPLHQSVQR